VNKVHHTAVVLIPPEEVWGPIQAVRERYDRNVERWMPHVTLLYPFRPPEAFEAAAPLLASACEGIAPFAVTLSRFDRFRHRRSFTLWIAPEPAEPVAALQESLRRHFPDCDDVNRFPRGFQPHLSVGQAEDENALRGALSDVTRAWKPIEFTAGSVSLIRRGRDTGDVFVVEREFPLGGEGKKK
jgi:2'-5' RNA ligase